jgi:cobalt-zinc-cadmium efflux system outer membrane protein
MKLKSAWTGVLALAFAMAGPAAEPPVVDAAFLEALRVEVRTNHPSIAAAQARVEAAGAEVLAVRLWEDPMAGVGFMAAPRGMRAEEGDVMFGLGQTLPRRKLYEARKERAGAGRAVSEAEARAAALELETLSAQSAIELALADEMLVLEERQLAWLESMAANARERLKDPQASASEPLRLESETAQQRQRLDALQRQRERLARQLNIVLGRSEDAVWPRLRLPSATGPVPALADEQTRLYQTNPRLQARLQAAEAARWDIEVARRERSPMFSLGVDSSIYSGGGDVAQTVFGAKMTLPWFNNSIYRANTERARQQQAAAEKDIEALTRRLHAELVAAHIDAETAARQAQILLQEVLPRMEQAAESTQHAWITSRANILEVLDARRSLLRARLDERRAVAASRAALETLRSLAPPFPQP